MPLQINDVETRNPKLFSSSYFEARDRFRQAALKQGLSHEALPIQARGPNNAELTIDVAIANAKTEIPKQTLIVSSGLHGAEGFLGSAVQLQMLEGLNAMRDTYPSMKFVFVHALNPYGCAWVRRNNENNVDLNRNFHWSLDGYKGAPQTYRELADFLAPKVPPSQSVGFYLKTLLYVARYGISKLVGEIPMGQYEFPQGIFYGGKKPEESHTIWASHIENWAGESGRVIHVDFHTGLFKSGEYRLLQDFVNADPPTDEAEFQNAVQCSSPKKRVSYKATGGISKWMNQRFASRDIRSLTAEFGTIFELRVLSRIRSENQNYWWGTRDDLNHWTKADLKEAFAPSSAEWRTDALQKSGVIINELSQWLARPESITESHSGSLSCSPHNRDRFHLPCKLNVERVRHSGAGRQ